MAYAYQDYPRPPQYAEGPRAAQPEDGFLRHLGDNPLLVNTAKHMLDQTASAYMPGISGFWASLKAYFMVRCWLLPRGARRGRVCEKMRAVLLRCAGEQPLRAAEAADAVPAVHEDALEQDAHGGGGPVHAGACRQAEARRVRATLRRKCLTLLASGGHAQVRAARDRRQRA